MENKTKGFSDIESGANLHVTTKATTTTNMVRSCGQMVEIKQDRTELEENEAYLLAKLAQQFIK